MQPRILLALALAACSDDARGPAGDRIALPGDSFYPEGVAFTAGGDMFVSSILTGAIARVGNGESTATTFVEPGAIGGSAVAMKTSRRGDALWVCLGTFGSDAPPAVIGVDPASGAELARHPFPAQRDGRTGGLCNEIAEDTDGNVYASDSFGARIVRIAAADRLAATPAVAWAEGPELGATSFGVNGIALDEDGRAILAVNTTTGALLRVDLATAAIAAVDLERPLAGPDGLRVADDHAIVVEQGAGTVSVIDLRTGGIESRATGLREPTSLDVLDGTAWVSEGQLHHLFDMPPTAPELPFVVVRVPL